MASVSAAGKAGKPSFAKIAAANLKPFANAQQNTSTADQISRQDTTSSPRDGPSSVPTSIEQSATQEILVSSTQQKPQPVGPVDTIPSQVRIQATASTPLPATPSQTSDGLLVPAPSEEASTQLSSSTSDPTKPPSLDGKSVASGTTFALDEKESLRPDDSASVKATDDEDIFSPPSNGLPDSRGGSDDGVRAFREQLREISGMEPSRRPGPPPNFGQTSTPHQGVLYIPPSGPGVGTVPGSARSTPAANPTVEVPPDPKLLEALDSPKDRIMVLKLEQDIVDFVKDPKETSLKLPQTNAFYRMLAHRLADYYMLGHVVDESTQAVRIFKTPDCRIPPPLTNIATPSTAASTPPPLGGQMKILRRGDNVGPGNGSNLTSKTGSENGESGEDDKKPKVPVSREEREARYEAARKRIMGSAKPSDSPDESSQKELSRPGSTTGKKATKKKTRADSDDDFEARSAYFPSSFSPNGPSSQSYAMQGFTHSGNQMAPGSFGTQDGVSGYQQFVHHPQQSWSGHAYPAQGAQPSWTQTQQPGYDLATDFQRSMSFQPQMPPQPANGQQNYHGAYGTQYYGQQQAWPQQNFTMPGQASAPAYSYLPNYQSRPSSSGQSQENQPCAFGQLPSQTFPGRPPNKLEHPLPGSYKSKNFNPQSQSFHPGQPGNGVGAAPSVVVAGAASQFNSPGHAGGYPGQMPTMSPQQQQQNPAFHQHPSAYSSPQTSQPQPSTPARLPSQPNLSASSSTQPLTHPLPQPVFARQPSPNLPLPPRPDASPSSTNPSTSHHGNHQHHQHQPSTPSNPASLPLSQHNQHQQTLQSSLAKWGTPASLPPKPPPSAEPFDAAKFPLVGGSATGGGTAPGGVGAGGGRGVNGFTAQSSTLPAPPQQPGFGSTFAGGQQPGNSGANGRRS